MFSSPLVVSYIETGLTRAYGKHSNIIIVLQKIQVAGFLKDYFLGTFLLLFSTFLVTRMFLQERGGKGKDIERVRVCVCACGSGCACVC